MLQDIYVKTKKLNSNEITIQTLRKKGPVKYCRHKKTSAAYYLIFNMY